MKKMYLLVLLLLSLNAHAQWQVFSELEDGTWYFDPTTQTAGKLPRVWALFDHKEPVGAFGILSIKTWVEADCQAGWVREMSLLVFNQPMAAGSVLRNTSPGTNKIFPVPGSAYDKLAHMLCH